MWTKGIAEAKVLRQEHGGGVGRKARVSRKEKRKPQGEGRS